MGARGFIKIQEIKSDKFLFMSEIDYKFIKKRKADKSKLNDFELDFYRSLFGGKESVLLSDLKNKFYVNIDRLENKIYNSLLDKKYFLKSPKKVRNAFSFYAYAAVISLHFALISLFIVVLERNGYVIPSLLSMVLCFLMLWRFTKKMPRKTKEGGQVYKEVWGLKEFIEKVEAPRIKRMVNEDSDFFGKILPYAIVLGCADEWAKKFEGIKLKAPDWYESESTSLGHHFLAQRMVTSMGHSLNTMSNTFQSAPRQSSSAGSGGSFSGGGGFSGGGFGGGGGGSW